MIEGRCNHNLALSLSKGPRAPNVLRQAQHEVGGLGERRAPRSNHQFSTSSTDSWLNRRAGIRRTAQCPMSGNFPKSRHRSTPDHAAPFDLVLDQLRKQQDVPSDASSHLRVVPPGDWPYPAADVAAASPATSAAQMYEVELAATAP